MNKFISKQSLAVAALLCSSTGFAATVTVTPSTATPNIGENFSLTVSGSGFPDTVGATLKIFFDSAKVALRSPTLGTGVVLAAGSPFTGGIAYSGTNPFVSGNIISVLAPTVGTLPSGTFDAFVMNFTALVNFGLLSPSSLYIELRDDQGDFSWTDATTFSAIPVTYTQATLGAVPAPAAVWLLATGVVALAGRRLSRKAA